MRFILIAAAATALAACPPVTQRLDDTTGTSLEERCVNYRATLAGLDALRADRELTESEANRRLVYQGIVDAACPPVTE